MSNEIFAPFKPPFHYDSDGGRICDSNNELMVDLRGWGYLTGKGTGGLGMDNESAASIQDRIGIHITNLLNVSVGIFPDKG